MLDWYNGKLKNIWNGYEVIKSYHVEREILTDYEKCNWEVERTHFSVRNTQNMSRSISGGVGFLIDVCMMGIAGILVLKGYCYGRYPDRNHTAYELYPDTDPVDLKTACRL